jgi:hypothetical protein
MKRITKTLDYLTAQQKNSQPTEPGSKERALLGQFNLILLAFLNNLESNFAVQLLQTVVQQGTKSSIHPKEGKQRKKTS